MVSVLIEHPSPQHGVGEAQRQQEGINTTINLETSNKQGSKLTLQQLALTGYIQ